MKIETLVDAEGLKLIKEKKSWWKFLITKGDEVVAPKCGDKFCDKDEGSEICPEDCGAGCGNGLCESVETGVEKNEGETVNYCPYDCGYCGDDVCGDGEENCAIDCLSACGNGICEKDESAQSCPYDCTGF